MHVQRGPGRLVRKFADLAITGLEGDGTFSGYASVFGEVDLSRDIIEPGAFRQSLKSRGVAGIRMLYQHDPAQPIGTWITLKEDARGLYVVGRLTAGVARAEEVRALMKSGALDGLSIGFQTVKARQDGKTGIRHILQADLWEISVVTFPMAPSARVSSVKAQRLTSRDAELIRSMRRAARMMTFNRAQQGQ
ncbi:HK97 family phage prohead protease [Allorhizobium sp. BGMRC 0089]|uniref:HK97 family phage prohead protease n=1 Tax=Allorhizobium sonneratiae TaxID=2934936 RepID=UPI0020339957|nr:HK97 family phage prohead protease [Allorhizobium sonneratiae]MCM2291897.1 HK97 family phage prohead protease [Allorhizobium sonneratiae]